MLPCTAAAAVATNTTAVVGGVLCILAVLILLASVSTTLLVIYHCKNNVEDSSPGVTDTNATVLPTSSAPVIHNPAIGKFHIVMTDSQDSIYLGTNLYGQAVCQLTSFREYISSLR